MFLAINPSSEKNSTYLEDQIHVAFGKDYCAAISCACSESRTWDGSQPPFWQFFSAQVSDDECTCVTLRNEEENADRQIISKTGIYEGEPLLYFTIAAKDVHTSEWLLLQRQLR